MITIYNHVSYEYVGQLLQSDHDDDITKHIKIDLDKFYGFSNASRSNNVANDNHNK